MSGTSHFPSHSVTVRAARAADAEAIRAIYNWAVRNSTATMDLEERTPEAQAAWMEAHDGDPYPALVAEAAGVVIGYAALSRYNSKPGYDGTTDNSLYIHPDWHRRGIGAALLAALLDEARARGFETVLALITADNAASLALHARFGFVTAGLLKRVGRKFDRRVDVAFMQIVLDKQSPNEEEETRSGNAGL